MFRKKRKTNRRQIPADTLRRSGRSSQSNRLRNGIAKLLGLPKPRFFSLLLVELLLLLLFWGLWWLLPSELPEPKWITVTVLDAILIAAILWAAGQEYQPPEPDERQLDDFVRILVDKAEPIALFTAAALFILEAPQRITQQDIEIAIESRGPTEPRRQSIERLIERDIELSGIDLTATDLADADLSHLSLRRVNFSRANLERVNLNSSDLRRADLSDANLRDASLYRANLSHAQLSLTDLTDAELREANLRGSNLDNAKLCRTSLPTGMSLDPNRDCEELGF